MKNDDRPSRNNSLLMSSAVRRVLAALGLTAGLWLAVAWALSGGS